MIIPLILGNLWDYTSYHLPEKIKQVLKRYFVMQILWSNYPMYETALYKNIPFLMKRKHLQLTNSPRN